MDKPERHMLIAVDESANARRAVRHVADFFGGIPGFEVTILHIFADPSEDYFSTDREREEWTANQRARVHRMLEEYRQMLIESGFAGDKVHTEVQILSGHSVAENIIRQQQRLGCGTVVIGRRGISKQEEFIFGSTSNKILHEAKNCAVLVVE